MKFNLAFALAIALMLSACASSRKGGAPAGEGASLQTQAPLASRGPVDVSGIKAILSRTGGPRALPLTASGENSDPSFAPDGEHVLYLSRERVLHKNGQDYELALKSRLERRVTYHDGEDSTPSYRPDGGRVLYASTTDEIKEDPNSIRGLRERYGTGARAGAPPESRLGPYEIYLAKVDGGEIRRLSSSEGYDSEGRFDPQGRRIAFASTRGTRSERTQIYLMRADGGAAHPALRSFDDDGSPVFSADGKRIAFVRRALDSAVAHIYVLELRSGARPHALTTVPATNLSPSWSPNGREILYASNRADGRTFDIWSSSTDGACAKRITDAEGSETQPSLSADGSRLLFSGDQSGHKQIYLMPYSAPASCLSD